MRKGLNIFEAALERRDLARECIEEKNQRRGLITIIPRSLSGPADASKIAPVSFTVREATCAARAAAGGVID
jgi:hypothetical protein